MMFLNAGVSPIEYATSGSLSLTAVLELLLLTVIVSPSPS